MVKGNWFLIVIIGIFVFAMHIPFLLSDPDYNNSEGRDANTDEGLYSAQIRNYINHGDVTFNKMDCFVKTPLFGAYLFLPYKLLGTSRFVGRLSVLLLSLIISLSILFKLRRYSFFVASVFVFVFSQYYVFNYFHFCMSEILATVFIFLSLFFLVNQNKTKVNVRAIVLSTTCISISYYLKIQFLYAIFILPLALLFYLLFGFGNRKNICKQLCLTLGFLLLHFAVYYLVWIYPNYRFIDYIISNQIGTRMSCGSATIDTVLYNWKHVFYNSYLLYFCLSFFVLLIIGFYRLWNSKSAFYSLFFVAVFAWFIVELHKLSMPYFPTRYIISLLFAMGLLMGLVVNDVLINRKTSLTAKLLSVLVVITIATCAIKNGIDYYHSFKRRTFSLLEIDTYLSKFDLQNQKVIGTWAPSVTWSCKATTFLIEKHFFNDVDVIKREHPRIIIAEVDEEDSNQAFSSQGIAIDSAADSIRYFTVNKWKLKVLWIKQSKTMKSAHFK